MGPKLIIISGLTIKIIQNHTDQFTNSCPLDHTKILVATVGGSCAPVVNAARMGGYDHVFFIPNYALQTPNNKEQIEKSVSYGVLSSL
ncbi:MAG: hypothetical protein DRP28_01850, partial [Thermodesulfobacteriota bacterium]